MKDAPVDSEVYKSAMAAKDAEIERLKRCARFSDDSVLALLIKVEEKDKLITELCDALEQYVPHSTNLLINRAREAAR